MVPIDDRDKIVAFGEAPGPSRGSLLAVAAVPLERRPVHTEFTSVTGLTMLPPCMTDDHCCPAGTIAPLQPYADRPLTNPQYGHMPIIARTGGLRRPFAQSSSPSDCSVVAPQRGRRRETKRRSAPCRKPQWPAIARANVSSARRAKRRAGSRSSMMTRSSRAGSDRRNIQFCRSSPASALRRRLPNWPARSFPTARRLDTI